MKIQFIKNGIPLCFLIMFFLPNSFMSVKFNYRIIANGFIISTMILLVISRKIKIKKISHRNLLYAIAILVFVYPIFISGSSLFLSNDVIWRDLGEIDRFLVRILGILAPFYWIQEKRDLTLVNKLLITLACVILFFSILHFWKQSYPFLVSYGKPANFRFNRISAPFANPYDLGFVSEFFVFYFFFKFLNGNKINIIVSFLFFLVTVLTQSRSVVISLLLFFPVAMLIGMKISIKKVIASGVFLCIALIGFLFIFDLDYLINGIKSVTSGNHVNSLSVRIDQIKYATSSVSESFCKIIFGSGVSKGEMEYLESYIAFYFYRYGIIGFILIFLLPMGIFIFLSIKCLRKDKEPFPFAYLFWSLSFFVSGISNAYIENIKTGFMFFFFSGIIIRIYTLKYNY